MADRSTSSAVSCAAASVSSPVPSVHLLAKGVKNALFAVSQDGSGAYFFDRGRRSLSYFRFSDNQWIPFQMEELSIWNFLWGPFYMEELSSIEGDQIQEFESLGTVKGYSNIEHLIFLVKTEKTDRSFEKDIDHEDDDYDDGIDKGLM